MESQLWNRLEEHHRQPGQDQSCAAQRRQTIQFVVSRQRTVVAGSAEQNDSSDHQGSCQPRTLNQRDGDQCNAERRKSFDVRGQKFASNLL